MLWSTFSTENGAGGFVMIPSAGQHTINLFMREAGTSVDQIMLTTDKAFRPANAPAVPAVTIASTSASSGTIREGNATGVTYTFTRSSGAGENTLTVQGSVVGGDTNANDYTITGSGVTYNASEGTFSIEFGINDVQKQITVKANSDLDVEGEEYVVLELTEPTGASPTYHIGGSTQIHTTIIDTAVISIEAADQSGVTIREGESAIAAFVVKRTFAGEAMEVTVKLPIYVQGTQGLASLDADYTVDDFDAPGGDFVVSWDAEDESLEKTIYLSATPDSRIEGDEDIKAALYTNNPDDNFVIGEPDDAEVTIQECRWLASRLLTMKVTKAKQTAFHSRYPVRNLTTQSL